MTSSSYFPGIFQADSMSSNKHSFSSLILKKKKRLECQRACNSVLSDDTEIRRGIVNRKQGGFSQGPAEGTLGEIVINGNFDYEV